MQVTATGRLGLAVLATFMIVWAPFLGRRSDVAQVLHRIVPMKRGLYEDYVANFWCTTSLLIKWRSLFSQQVCALCAFQTRQCLLRNNSKAYTGCCKDLPHELPICAGSHPNVLREHPHFHNANPGQRSPNANSQGPADVHGLLCLCILPLLLSGVFRQTCLKPSRGNCL